MSESSVNKVIEEFSHLPIEESGTIKDLMEDF